jgi:hypothetical protein
MTRDLDLLKVDVDLVATVSRLRGASTLPAAQTEDASEGDHSEHDDRPDSST